MVKKILLTGGNSFIGKNLIEQLGNRHDFVAPKSSELDLTDAAAVKDFLRKTKPEIVIHAANIGGKRNQQEMNNVVENNLRMFFNLVRGKEYFERMIVLGSGAEYDKSRSIKAITEAEFDERVPLDQYGFAKYIMSKYAKKNEYITHLRLFGVYGQYEDYTTRFMSNMICRALYCLPLKINQNAVFDYMFVDDLVKIVDLFITKKPKETFYNVGSGQGIELLSIAEKIKTLINPELKIEVSKLGLNKEYTCNCDALFTEIGEYIDTDLEETLREMISYYQANLKKIDPQLL